MNFTWFGNFVVDMLMKDIHKRCVNEMNREFVKMLSKLASRAVSTLVFTILITGLVADIMFDNSYLDHVFAVILLVLVLIAVFMILFIVISVISNYPVQNDGSGDENTYQYVTVDVGDYHGMCCIDESDSGCISQKTKKTV